MRWSTMDGGVSPRRMSATCPMRCVALLYCITDGPRVPNAAGHMLCVAICALREGEMWAWRQTNVNSLHSGVWGRTMSFSIASRSSSDSGFTLCRRVAADGVSEMQGRPKGEPACPGAPLYLFVGPGWAPGPWPRPRCWAPDCRRWPPRTPSGLGWPVHWEGGVRVSPVHKTHGPVRDKVCVRAREQAHSRTHCLMLCVVSTVALGKLMRFTYAYVFSNTLCGRASTPGTTPSAVAQKTMVTEKGRQCGARTVFSSCLSPPPCLCLWPACCPAPA